MFFFCNDNICRQFLDSLNRINLAIACNFICGVCTGECICCLISQKYQLNFLRKQELLLTTQNGYSADMEEVMSHLIFRNS